MATTVLLDTHVLYWWSSQPEQLSAAARRAIERSDVLAVASMSWYELGWLVRTGRISLTVPIATWLDGLAAEVRTLGTTPRIAAAAVALPDSFPRDPADRIIYATALEHGLPLVTKDEGMHAHARSKRSVIW